jgi:hypothetical protein
MKTEMLALVLFNERVERLTRSALAKRMENPQYTIDYERMMRREWASLDGVTEDAVNAFVLNIRVLIEDPDGFSIRRLAEDLYSQPSVPEELRSRYAEQRDKWNEHMARDSMFTSLRENKKFTNRDLFDVMLYGGLAHARRTAERDKIALFYDLTTQGAVSSLVSWWFLHSLRIFLDVVRAIRDINDELLKLYK